MAVPNKYITASPFNISFDWSDHLTNTGYKRYYACSAYEDGGIIYFLTVRQLDARPILTTGVAELNFDIEFRRPVTVRGVAIMNSTIACPTDAATYTTQVIVYHVSTVPAETSIGTEISGNHLNVGANKFYRDCLEIDITETKFGVGEKIRLAITLTATAGVPSLYHDPNSGLTKADGDDARTINTDLTFDIPFKLIT